VKIQWFVRRYAVGRRRVVPVIHCQVLQLIKRSSPFQAFAIVNAQPMQALGNPQSHVTSNLAPHFQSAHHCQGRGGEIIPNEAGLNSFVLDILTPKSLVGRILSGNFALKPMILDIPQGRGYPIFRKCKPPNEPGAPSEMERQKIFSANIHTRPGRST
jgi:hypothetical protein